tara:strand:+ start:6066 stop:6272 length:207 start_codon:yes stop_codon:yes gene_type:complete
MATRAKSVDHAEYEILCVLMANIDLEDLMDEMVTDAHSQKRWDKACAKIVKWMTARRDVRGNKLGLNK